MYGSDNLTREVLSVVGSPFAPRKELDFNPFSHDLYHYAKKNRMVLHYLDALGEPGIFDKEIKRLRARYDRVADAILRVSHILRKAGVKYAFFKTIRPYKEVTVDLDLLILGPQYHEAIRALKHAGYLFLDGDIRSTTYRDIAAELNIDLYNEVSASRLIYVDKSLLEDFVIQKQFSNYETVECLSQSADLLCVIAHSVLKEQMYVLSEYYTSLYFISEMSNSDLDQFIDLVQRCKLVFPSSTHLGATAYLHRSVHGFVPRKILEIISRIGYNQKELSRINKNRLSMPYKYHVTTFAYALLEKFGERKARRSFAHQALSMLDPSFGMKAFSRISDHLFREAY